MWVVPFIRLTRNRYIFLIFFLNKKKLKILLFIIFNYQLSLKHPARSMMYAIGIVITLEDNATLEEFIFSHFALLENRLHQLHTTAFRLLCHFLKKSPPSSSIN